MDRRLKIILITLVVILLAIVSFMGIFVQDTKFMVNILPDYQLGMDLAGYRVITIVVSDETETVYYDADGNQVTEETEDGTSEEIPINGDDVLTLENFEKTKQIIEDRLSDLSISEYLIRLDEDNGTVTVYLPEDDMTDTAAQFLYTVGEFTVENEDGEILLDNSNLDVAQVGYTSYTTGTTIYLTFTFNDDSIETLKDISNTYVESTDEDGNDTSQEVSINIDGTSLLETTFDEEITNGVLVLTLGTSTDTDTLNSYLTQATNIAILLNNGKLPITYTVEQNRFIKSDITLNDMIIPAIVLGIILIIAFIFLMIRYKKLGLFAVISFVGYMALLLIVVRYTNLVVTFEGICGILISAILNYILLVYILQKLKNAEKSVTVYREVYNKSMISMILILIPTIIIGIILCFASWLPVYSFGTIIFWGVLVIAIYNAFITKIMFLNSIKDDTISKK